MSLDYDKILSIAKIAATQAGNYLKENFSTKPKVEFKGEIDLVTERDRKSQEIIQKIISKNFPEHSILGEEDLKLIKKTPLLWIVDPLDGTTNYSHSLPVFCVSIAFMVEEDTRVGVIYNPMLDELFWAVKGKGAFLNGKRIKVSDEIDLRRSLLATGFPYDIRRSRNNNIDYFNKFILKAQAVRRCGSAALDLAYLSAGRYDGFWEIKLFPWDTAAGVLMVEEAGGKVTDFSGKPFKITKKECLATNGKIHSQMLEVLENAKKERKNRKTIKR